MKFTIRLLRRRSYGVRDPNDVVILNLVPRTNKAARNHQNSEDHKLNVEYQQHGLAFT